jgi:hypothetical protein
LLVRSGSQANFLLRMTKEVVKVQSSKQTYSAHDRRSGRASMGANKFAHNKTLPSCHPGGISPLKLGDLDVQA